ncbi:cytochrome c biogenesis protein CcdA, partial [Candidatus Woesearchaeota archaeon]|nr:cytochrome c biogenesis protein CcdA [Candidatus Woesearchaeota archaeon]
MRKSPVTQWLIFSYIFLLAFLAFSSLALALEVPVGVEKLIAYERSLALQVTFLMAFFAGFVTITSPCGFALVPAYLAVAFRETKKSFTMASAFSFGLMLALVAFGVVAGLVGEFFNRYKLFFGIVSGAALIAFGLLLGLNKGIMGPSFAQWHHKTNPRKHVWGMILFGAFFGAGWTPCIGPVLIGILLLGANLGNIFQSALLLLAYAIGAAFPLMLLSMFADKFPSFEERVKGRLLHFTLFGKKVETHTYNLVGGAILLVLGFLMI